MVCLITTAAVLSLNHRSEALLFPGLLTAAVITGLLAIRQTRVHRRPSLPVVERIGPYVLKRKLGAGGMGEVYLAEHALMKRSCAVKLIHPRQAHDREMQERFAREAKATAQLTHWNTIEVYDYGTAEDGRFFYVMEFLEGVNLWQYVKQFGPMSPARVVYLLKQLCDALYEAECAGLVHRDIKPSNVFLTRRGGSYDVVKLLDFGLVQPISQQPVKIKNVKRRLHGSPQFMCPEQAVGLSPDHRGDLYSLGAVAYFLLSGRPPFTDENPIMLVVAHATGGIPPLNEIGVAVPQDLCAIVMKCLSRNPDDRFSSARSLLDALDSCSCAGEWTRKSAEQWWQVQQINVERSSPSDTIQVTQTLEYKAPLSEPPG
ncbi:MAG: serine/threonine-protein kinase [Planctomycetaceae bacterium]